MSDFHFTTHLSEILEKSDSEKVIIFKFSDSCLSSTRLENKIKETIHSSPIKIYKVTVQTEPVLSKKIEEHFEIKHETPQIIVLEKRKVVYTAHHSSIKIKDFL